MKSDSFMLLFGCKDLHLGFEVPYEYLPGWSESTEG